MKVYKTREFARLCRNASVADWDLCEAAERAEKGLVDASIGKFLIKQRIARRNEGRSGGFRAIVFHGQGDRAVFLHLFAKNERSNLTRAEQDAYRDIAKELADLTIDQIRALVDRQKWIEIDYESFRKKIPK